MAEGRSRERWAHTSSLLALMANAHRDPDASHVYKPGDFNPHYQRPEPIVGKADIGVLKQVFVDNRPQGG